LTLPNLFIPGAPKCGTTSLASYLAAHPDVFMGHLKEPNFWSSDLPFFARREGLSGILDYAALYADAPDGAHYRLDASTHYLFSRVAVDAIETNVPGARFIVCLRPQPEIAQAWHMQMLNAGYEDIDDFEQAWLLREERQRGRSVPRQCPEPALLDYSAVACVGRQVARLLDRVPAERVCIVSLANLRSDVRRVYVDVLRFLDLPDDGRSSFPASNRSFVNRSATLTRLARHPAIRPWFNRAMRTAGPAISSRFKSAVKRALYRPGQRRALDPAFARELEDAFTADDQTLREATGITLMSPPREAVPAETAIGQFSR